FITEYVWRACPATMNGNEQAHRNVNRDGVNLTLLGGIMRGPAFDDRAAQSIDDWALALVICRGVTQNPVVLPGADNGYQDFHSTSPMFPSRSSTLLICTS
ncbi:hypothetical protein BDR03DRAFT_965204, partial [Suillus americanus]